MNISDIAKLAGVSTSTVSRYFNNGYISAEKKAIIKKIVEETGYQPSTYAQTLRTKQTRLIGVIIPKLNSETVSKMVGGINQILSEEDYLLLLGDTENDEREELKFLQVFNQNQVDGIILIGTIFTAKHKKLIKDSKVPLVLLGQTLPGVSSVYHDNYNASKQMTRHLIKTGKVFAMITATEEDKAAGLDRKNGFLDALREAEIDPDKIHFGEARFSIDSAREVCQALFTKNPEIDTLFCATDNMAIGAYQYLASIGKSIPEQVQLCGVGNSTIANVPYPAISSVGFPYEGSGQLAAELLVDALSEGDKVNKEIKIGYEMALKDSTR